MAPLQYLYNPTAPPPARLLGSWSLGSGLAGWNWFIITSHCSAEGAAAWGADPTWAGLSEDTPPRPPTPDPRAAADASLAAADAWKVALARRSLRRALCTSRGRAWTRATQGAAW